MVKLQVLIRLLMLIALSIVALVIFASAVLRADGVPVQKADLTEERVYAYRGWQSMGIFLHPGDVVTIIARGRWLYSPDVGYNGPEGASPSQYPAPSYYPVPNGIGGCLIGRIGESGDPFYVGRRATIRSDALGLLYLRINDDMVTDNDGYVTVEITVESPPAE
ncbi:MAG: LecA/PA-IL family lectin [Anaerolineae bacterium]|nr:LecA/PA-IL family lectin [Anaerolineae bacterium]